MERAGRLGSSGVYAIIAAVYGKRSQIENLGTLDVSVIVPTINEAENLPLLVSRIAAALAGVSFEILIVDDNSRDNTGVVSRNWR